MRHKLSYVHGKHIFAGIRDGAVILDTASGKIVWQWKEGVARMSPDKKHVLRYNNKEGTLELATFPF